MNVLIWTYLIRYISITKKKTNKEGKHTLKRNDNTKQHRWKSREIKVILKTSQNVVTQRSMMWPKWRSRATRCIGINLRECLSPYIEWKLETGGRGRCKQFSEWQIDASVCARVYRKAKRRNRWTFTFNFAFLFNVLHLKATIKIHKHTDTLHCIKQDSSLCWAIWFLGSFEYLLFKKSGFPKRNRFWRRFHPA